MNPSFHSTAQERLLEFLLEQAKTKHHQIVFSTHSPSMLTGLPSKAIKVFEEGNDGRCSVINSCHPYAAFIRLGAPVPEKIQIYVEDRLAKAVVEVALSLLGNDQKQRFDVSFVSGGAQAYFCHRIPTWMHHNPPPYVYLDGDQKPAQAYVDPDTIPAADNERLKEKIKEATGGTAPNLLTDGGRDPKEVDNKYKLEHSYLRYLFQRVKFLPGLCPEDIVLRILINDSQPKTSQEAKYQLAAHYRKNGGQFTQADIDKFAEKDLWDSKDTNSDVQALKKELEEIAKNQPSRTRQVTNEH